MAAEVVVFDVVEQILVRLDVEDLIRFKSVCKPWYYLISSPGFVKAHLKRSYENDRDNPELGHRRIGMNNVDDFLLNRNLLHVVGSSNGLVCVSPINAELVVTNPLTRESKYLRRPPFFKTTTTGEEVRNKICWGFGFDSSIDDYKVIAGFEEQEHMLFYVLTLKSDVWKLICEVKYRCVVEGKGMLCGGALHWVLRTNYAEKWVITIVSVDLSTEEFKEIPQPTDGEYECQGLYLRLVLGVSEECLCIQSRHSVLSAKKWIMKNNKWEHHNESTYDIAHVLITHPTRSSLVSVYCHDDDGVRVPSGGIYTRASIFVKSLVSPHPYVNNDSNYDGQKRRKAMGQGQEANEC